ncbi:acetyl-CoA synthetase-like protein [Trametes coccinea BRFM310]|uniref:Acetyl-CoA synthetase-like protein n=1 Tax=Trametes coccinea (strain BRFM310) TaxID=1353009 RepID=A0A1Y2IJ13_TRAC3|nr:acetyl-CoA synthetase-like protein [Trametes coccinea BRFM310]
MPLTHADVPSNISTEFRAPFDLLKQDVALPQIYDWHAKENPNYPLFTYHDGEKPQYITYAAANRAIDRAARYVASALGPRKADAPPPTVAVFANADTITYFCNTLGVLRAGATAFLISTRNGAAAVADLLERTGSSQLMLSQDIPIRDVANEALSRLPEGQVTVRDMPTFEDLFPSEGTKSSEAFEADVEFPKTFDPNSYALILHSSGSTGHPKPLRWTHRRLTLFGTEPLHHDVDSSGWVFGCHGIPMFHAMGTFMYPSAPVNGFVVATFKPARPPTFPTPDAVWQASVATKCDIIFTVPSNIEEWARDPEKVAHMQRLRGLLFGGAPLNTEVGNSLAAQGVSLLTVYGLTEVGLINKFLRVNPGMDWSYWTPVTTKEVKFVPRENKFEVVVLSNPEVPLSAINTQLDGRDAYATSDLVEPHPTKPNHWRIFGRADEQIILSNGEKTNPLPLEKIINQDPHVKCSMMFGSGKFQNGVLVEPVEEYAIDPSDPKQVEEFRNRIWPTIERANEYAPQHSRIFKEMILITSPTKPFQVNVKGLPRRKLILADYHDEIEALYKEVENNSQSDIQPPTSWDEKNTLAFVRAVVDETLRRSIGDDADIFRNGGDSLQATWIRNTILRAMRDTDAAAARRLPMNLVFQAPTISALARIVHAIMSNADADGAPSHTPQDLWKYVDKFSANFPERPANLVERPAGGKDVVVITGTTGGFGCDALEHLLRDDAVERVYAFNRKGSKALERQRAQFRARGLDESLLDSPKFRMVEAALHEPDFGLEPALLDEVRQSVTHIMHNAWKVDFNLSIQSFEMDIQGARNLVDLAISSPYRQAPTVVFVSSIGVFMNYSGPVPAPEAPLDDSSSPFGAGYGEGKWVTEHVLQNVTKQRGVHTVVMRLGQVCGDRVGHWNEKEWFPALVKSALFQRCLPDIEGNVAWVPGYESAKAFTEMRRSPEPFVHLVHPRPAPWRTVIEPIAHELGVPLVPYEQWLAALRQSVSGGGGSGNDDEVALMKANPALRLVDFFRELKTSPDREPMGMVYLSTEKSARVSEALATLPALDAERAKAWLAAWKRSGFLA